MELQYLTTKEDQKDWMAALLEINFAPAWSIYGSDMYNHGKDKIHYYNVGASYAKSRTRIALSYGRNKEGYVCSGGVCRTIPKYTGANPTITTSILSSSKHLLIRNIEYEKIYNVLCQV